MRRLVMALIVVSVVLVVLGTGLFARDALRQSDRRADRAEQRLDQVLAGQRQQATENAAVAQRLGELGAKLDQANSEILRRGGTTIVVPASPPPATSAPTPTTNPAGRAPPGQQDKPLACVLDFCL